MSTFNDHSMNIGYVPRFGHLSGSLGDCILNSKQKFFVLETGYLAFVDSKKLGRDTQKSSAGHFVSQNRYLNVVHLFVAIFTP